jgi:hypothetical protein
MDDFFDDLNDELLEIQQSDLMMPPTINSTGFSFPKAGDFERDSQDQDGDVTPHRKIPRIGKFTLCSDPSNPKHKIIDKGTQGELFIKDTLGKGAFCKVKAVEAKVVRDLPKKDTRQIVEVEGWQQMAVKVYDRKSLKGQKTTTVDPISGFPKMSDQL